MNVYELIFKDEIDFLNPPKEFGITAIGIVDEPAVELEKICFNELIKNEFYVFFSK